MTTETSRTVGEIVAEHPGTARLFQKYGIDFCCGGKRPLEQACQDKGIAAETFQTELDAVLAGPAPDTRDWNRAPLAELIDHIVETHHAYLRSELPRLDTLLAKVLNAHGERFGNTLNPLAAVFSGLKEELESHLRKEEMILFPFVNQVEEAQAAGGRAPRPPFGSFANPIGVMEAEHETAGNALAEMRRLTGGYVPPEGVCNTFRALYWELDELERDLHTHIHLENNILFPRAIALQNAIA
jgi:regulator of cell morphogenesis and NO signaling